MNESLSQKQCVPCEGGVAPLDEKAAKGMMEKLASDWQLSDDAGKLSRTVRFRNYHETMAFVNAVAWIAHQQDHHPDMAVSYNQCQVDFSTHAIGGLSENDFICAAKVDQLLHT
ncbi:4a-hydroxytetrahydrobiopterin dehydratase [Ectothiorhodospira sp. BSL-9]|uniref:4a-hydroxytetrahydrobiopterin dehydratase n=1 Tax=Ectothiorhodospira sp. BSL-9 TaxID=1442136 RepID=UPI0007B4553E|nr:4a-hydroxytetrahydrobiopterin dehydratase [Ectothiorhodospira sp. BSL-9]ANB03869.1 pterin-4-alpha-carbinolamine dehydratase [Ectothiorhodospira sp. BSL-9]TVQ74686.1 MAG: 4a-hydroxytetrahydrobiopterin dehydratase [Chromatiaceae bacterium]